MALKYADSISDEKERRSIAKIGLLLSDPRGSIMALTVSDELLDGRRYFFSVEDVENSSQNVSFSFEPKLSVSKRRGSCLHAIQFIEVQNCNIDRSYLEKFREPSLLCDEIGISVFHHSPQGLKNVGKVVSKNKVATIYDPYQEKSIFVDNLIEVQCGQTKIEKLALFSGAVVLDEKAKVLGIILGLSDAGVFVAPIGTILAETNYSWLTSDAIANHNEEKDRLFSAPLKTFTVEAFAKSLEDPEEAEFVILTWLLDCFNRRDKLGARAFEPFSKYFKNGKSTKDQLLDWQKSEFPNLAISDMRFTDWLDLNLEILTLHNFTNHLTESFPHQPHSGGLIVDMVWSIDDEKMKQAV